MYYNLVFTEKPEKPENILKKVVVNSQQVGNEKCTV
jgi:hypothetical protein